MSKQMRGPRKQIIDGLRMGSMFPVSALSWHCRAPCLPCSLLPWGIATKIKVWVGTLGIASRKARSQARWKVQTYVPTQKSSVLVVLDSFGVSWITTFLVCTVLVKQLAWWDAEFGATGWVWWLLPKRFPCLELWLRSGSKTELESDFDGNVFHPCFANRWLWCGAFGEGSLERLSFHSMVSKYTP